MTLHPNGLITEGAGACERRWKLTESEMQIHGDHGLIATLRLDSRGVFVGKWHLFEQMPVELVPTWKPMSRNNGFVWHVDPTIERCDADLTDHEDWIYEYLGVPERGLFVDVGAFVGQHSIRVAKAFGCRVIAIEPIPKHANVIEINARLNNVANAVDVVRSCVGQQVASVRLRDDGMSSRVEENGTVDAEMQTLSTLLKDEPDVDLIKIDVEGMELDVLSGIQPRIVHAKRILVEVHTYLASHLEHGVRDWCTTNNYDWQVVKRENSNCYCYMLLTRRTM